MNKSVFVAALSLASVVACAKRPGAIVPIEIPMAACSNLSCQQLAEENIKGHGKLASLSKTQNNAATGDAVGVFLIGVPASGLTGGDKEGDIAVSKGKVVAIESAGKAKGCK